MGDTNTFSNSIRGFRSTSSHASDSSSEDGSEDDAPKASTSALKATTAPVKAAADEDNESDADSDDSSSSSASSSSSSSFLSSSSDESADNRRSKGKAVASQRQPFSYSYADSQQGGASATGFGGQEDTEDASNRRPALQRRPSPTREASPPFIQFGPDADMLQNQKAFGNPILWGLLPSDVQAESTLAPEAKEELERAKAKYGRFREHYVSRLIDRFGEELDGIRKKEGSDLKESRLKVLISSI